MASQSKLGLLPQRRSGLVAVDPPRADAGWTDMTDLIQLNAANILAITWLLFTESVAAQTSEKTMIEKKMVPPLAPSIDVK
jgi:hypothetical protein